MNDVLRTYFDWEMDYGAIDISGRDNSGSSTFQRNAVKLSEICEDSFRDKVSQVAQDSQVSQVSRMR